MVVISSAELRNNMKKYLDLARSEAVFVQTRKELQIVRRIIPSQLSQAGEE